MTKYERQVIHPILSTIEKYQEFLTQSENLPQLAKLGFMFEIFWYSGRSAYGYEGTIKKGSSCENNPKYELGDTIKYLNSEIEDLVYDAWGMHVSNDGNEMTFEEIKNLILNGKELSDFEKEYRQPDKTFDQWVKLLTDKRYRYSSMYPNRQSVADHLLCVIGNGYGYNKETGVVFNEAGGADQDQDVYGEWENAKFDSEIQKIIEAVLVVPELQIAIDAQRKSTLEWKRKNKEDDDLSKMAFLKAFLPLVNKQLEKINKPALTIDSPEFEDVVEKYKEGRLKEIMGQGYQEYPEKKRKEYYPICNYSIITMFDERTHLSYIKAALEICEDIVTNPPEIKKDYNQFQIDQRNEMIEFANKFFIKWKTKCMYKYI